MVWPNSNMKRNASKPKGQWQSDSQTKEIISIFSLILENLKHTKHCCRRISHYLQITSVPNGIQSTIFNCAWLRWHSTRLITDCRTRRTKQLLTMLHKVSNYLISGINATFETIFNMLSGFAEIIAPCFMYFIFFSFE